METESKLRNKAKLAAAFAFALIGIAAGCWIYQLRVSSLTKALTGLSLPDFKPERIPANEQGVNREAEGQKKIDQAVQDAADKYNSPEEVAKREEQAAKENFDHLRKM